MRTTRRTKYDHLLHQYDPAIAYVFMRPILLYGKQYLKNDKVPGIGGDISSRRLQQLVTARWIQPGLDVLPPPAPTYLKSDDLSIPNPTDVVTEDLDPISLLLDGISEEVGATDIPITDPAPSYVRSKKYIPAGPSSRRIVSQASQGAR